MILSGSESIYYALWDAHTGCTGHLLAIVDHSEAEPEDHPGPLPGPQLNAPQAVPEEGILPPDVEIDESSRSMSSVSTAPLDLHATFNVFDDEGCWRVTHASEELKSLLMRRRLEGEDVSVTVAKSYRHAFHRTLQDEAQAMR